MNLTLPPKPKGKVASVEELIEFAGLRDIAEEVGIVQPGAGEAGPSSAAPRTVDGAIAPAIAARCGAAQLRESSPYLRPLSFPPACFPFTRNLAPFSRALARAGSCAACAVSDAPAQVRVPSYGGGGPAVPEALAGMVGADGKVRAMPPAPQPSSAPAHRFTAARRVPTAAHRGSVPAPAELRPSPEEQKKRSQRSHGGKGGDKGLRHFSMKVCEIGRASCRERV